MSITKPLLFSLFALSGFAGLIYESIWSHYIKLILGHAAYSQTLVLGIFMGGMALGAWIISRRSIALDNPLKWYALIELVIGCFGLLFHQEFLLAKEFLFTAALPSIESSVIASFTKWLIAALLLLPQAVLLGATFPLMSAAVIRFDKARSGNTLAMLYFTNSMGAAIGVLSSGFFLIEMFGLPGTGFTAGLINICIAIVIWPLAGDLKNNRPLTVNLSATAQNQQGSVKILLLIALLTGMASFFYEIGWIRMLSLVLGSSAQAFELMLSAFILGLALGSFFIRNRVDSIKNILPTLAWIQIVMGILATSTLPLYTQSFAAMSALRTALTPSDEGYVLFHIGSHLIAMTIMLPATFMAGMTLPLITNSLLKSGHGEGSIGRVYAANTIGAIIGIGLAINVLMPITGVKGLIVIGGSLDIIAGAILLFVFRDKAIAMWRYALPAAASLCAVIYFSQTGFDQSMLASGVYRSGSTTVSNDATPIFYRDGKTATIAVIDYANGGKSIRTNGKTDALINPSNMSYASDEVTMVMAAAVPLMFNPNAKHIANIGMGSGLTTHALLSTNRVRQVDTIEIERAMVEGAKLFGERVARAYDDERSRIHIDDAKSYFSSQGRQYDVIVSEPSNPWVSGVASLFTEEFYRHSHQYLKPGGLFVQWLQLYETNIDNISSVVRALDKVFVDYKIYNTDNANILIIASKDRLLDEPDLWVFDDEGLNAELNRVGIESIDDISIRYLGNKRSLNQFFAEGKGPANSDYYPYLSHNAPRSFFKREVSSELIDLHAAPLPVLRWTTNTPAIKRLSNKGKYFSPYASTIIAQKISRFSLNSQAVGSNIDRLDFALRRVSDALIDCQQSIRVDQTLKNSLHALAISVNPYLPQQQLEAFWETLTISCPLDQLNDDERLWLSLHSAIGTKNVDAIVSSSQQILQKNTLLQLHEYHYLIAAILAANIAADNPLASFPILRQYFSSNKIDRSPAYLKYLIGLTMPVNL